MHVVFVLSDPKQEKKIVARVALAPSNHGVCTHTFCARRLLWQMTSGEKHTDDDDKLDKSSSNKGAVEEAPEAEVVPLSWGGGMSFADILKKKEAAAIEAGTSS